MPLSHPDGGIMGHMNQYMKLLIVGDQHFRFELPMGQAFPDGRVKEWEGVKDEIHRLAKDVDAVVLLGDNLNSRHNHSGVINEFVTFLKRFGDKPIHILTGNHERYGKNTALDFLQKLNMPNWRVYTHVEAGVALGDVKATFIPYTTPPMVGALDNEEGANIVLEQAGRGDIVFAHHAVKGAKNAEFFNEIVLNRDELEKNFKLIFTGHLHHSEVLSKQTVVAGSVFTHEVGEEEKFVWTVDTSDMTYTKHNLPVRGIFKLFCGENDNWLYEGQAKIPAHSIVRAVVTSRSVSLKEVEFILEKFDASMIVEQYPNEREKTHFTNKVLDLSVDNLLKIFAQNKKLDYNVLKGGFELLQ